MVIVPSVDEADYRQSRLCRLLGNPIVFEVVRLLAEGEEMNTGEIAKTVGRSMSRVSNILGALRLADVVRYQTEGNHARYRLKHPRETRKVLEALSGFVKNAAPTHR
jgi:DNA-binding transcriptional ArsR family regulator